MWDYRQVGYWHIASSPRDMEFGRYRRIMDIGQSVSQSIYWFKAKSPTMHTISTRDSTYSFEITSFSDSAATIEARMIAETAERPTT